MMAAIAQRLPLVLRWTGVLLLIAGLQTWGFHHQIVPLIAVAEEQLAALQHEAADNRLMNESLQSLQAYWRVAADELSRRQALELRDSVLQQFATEPVAAVSEFARVVHSLEAGTTADPETLAGVRRRASRLDYMYTDHYAVAINAMAHPAWYLQPTAAFLNNDDTRNRSLALNRATYLSLIRDPAAAIEILDELRRERGNDSVTAAALFGLARLHFDAFQVDKDPARFDEALRHTRQTVISNPDHELGKLFLDYLVSIDRQAIEVDAEALEGEGSGEGEGEQGAIALEPEDF